jgi:hypothetical protein
VQRHRQSAPQSHQERRLRNSLKDSNALTNASKIRWNPSTRLSTSMRQLCRSSMARILYLSALFSWHATSRSTSGNGLLEASLSGIDWIKPSEGVIRLWVGIFKAICCLTHPMLPSRDETPPTDPQSDIQTETRTSFGDPQVQQVLQYS